MHKNRFRRPDPAGKAYPRFLVDWGGDTRPQPLGALGVSVLHAFGVSTVGTYRAPPPCVRRHSYKSPQLTFSGDAAGVPSNNA